ncbi:hypothetical protein EDD18DRAFT_1363734 [Armillaria luteobubalina]|uniref:Uncharacterized protein n=1 Tax=Armillaria luteobubalina TaxID=153913 RepID=A0AA39UFL8_9AGAR|nr:hypothetical protein EDD18DRAFT_1363734 [Armillaria luteobubalina]
MSKKLKKWRLGTTEDTSPTELEYETGTESRRDARTTRDLEDETSSNRAWYQFDLAVVVALHW